jgi:orotate phosphoribosyltransferase-like protein
MAAKLTAAERAEKMVRAVELSAKGKSNTEIAEEIGVTPKTVANLINNELARRAEHRDNGKEESIAVNRALIAEGWRRLETLGVAAPQASGLMNSIRASQERIDKVTGAEAPVKHQRVDEEIVVEWEDLDSVFAENEEE